MQIYVVLLFVFLTLTRFNWYLDIPGFSVNLFLIFFPLFLVVLVSKGYLKKIFNLSGLKKFYLAGLLGLLIADVLSLINAYNFSDTLSGIFYRFLCYFLVWIIISIFNRKVLKATIVGIFIAGIIVSLYGIWQFFRYLQGLSPFFMFESLLQSRALSVGGFLSEYNGSIFLRPSSTFFDPNNAAGYISICMIFVFGFLIWSWIKKSWVVFSTLLIVAIPLTTVFLMQISRSAILGLFAGLCFVILYCMQDRNLVKKVISMIFGVVLVLACLAYVLPAPFYVVKQRFLSINSEQNVADIPRVDFANGAIKVFKDNPLTGVGVGNFEQYFISEINTTYFAAHPHSAYLVFLSETGIIGFLFNIGWISFVLLIGIFTASWMHRADCRADRIILIVLLGGYISIVVGNIFYGYYPALFWCWAYTGILLGYINICFVSLVKKGAKRRVESIEILGVRIDNKTMKSSVDSIDRMISERGFHLVVTPYSEFFVRAAHDTEFKEALNGADMSLPDGVFVLWAARYLTIPVSSALFIRIIQCVMQYVFIGASLVFYPEYTSGVVGGRVSGSELLDPLCRMADRKGYTVFFLGGRDHGQGNAGILAAEKLKQKYSNLKISGVYPGDNRKESRSEALQLINKCSPDILVVCWGGGSGELWLYENRKKLKARVAIGLGGTFDFLAGYANKADYRYRRLGLEWFVRPFSKQAGGLPANLQRAYRVWNGMLKSSIMTMVFKIKHGSTDF